MSSKKKSIIPIKNKYCIVFDTRFKDRTINTVLRKWIEKETGINNITLYSLVDYIIIMCAILKRIDFSNVRAKKLLSTYEQENQKLKSKVNSQIYNQIIPSGVDKKIENLKKYLEK